MIRKASMIVVALIVAAAVTYSLGPTVAYPTPLPSTYTPITLSLSDLEATILAKELAVPDLKPDNQARIIWADSAYQRTPYSMIYLHGFSASQEEGDPVHTTIAQRYGANLYLARLADHGRSSDDTFKGLTPTDMVQSALDAIAIGHALGDTLIVISCSTGSTLSAYLAAQDANDIHAQIMYSPNIDLYDKTSELLLYPWAKEILGVVSGGDYRRLNYSAEAQPYWNSVYHTDGIMALKHLIDLTMQDEVFASIQQPLYLGYYYKNESEHDMVVSIPEMLRFYNEISTPDSLKRLQAFADVGHHVVSSHIMSQDVQSVLTATYGFVEEVLGIEPVPAKR